MKDGYADNLGKLCTPSLGRFIKSDELLEEDWAKVVLAAKILEVYKFADQCFVVAKLEGDDVREPFDYRHFQSIGGQWLNMGNGRADSTKEAEEKFSRIIKQLKKINETNQSIVNLLKIDGITSYRVDKKIADFPDKVDLSTPENAYVTGKQLIVSDRKDKIELLEKMQFTWPSQPSFKMPERERCQLENIPEGWATTYKNKFMVFEVVKLREDAAFVFGLRKFDVLYDGNFFRKQADGLWYNVCNLQSYNSEEIAKRITENLAALTKSQTESQ